MGMLIPMPAMPMQGPSEYSKSRSTVFCVLLVIQTIVCTMRLVLLLDIMGGFIMAIGLGLGWYAWKEHMDPRFIMYYGMMCLINGVFDLVKFIDYWVHSPAPLFSSALGSSYNLMSFTILAIPICLLPGAWFAYDIYTRANEEDT